MDNNQIKDLRGKVCFITGGSRGIGRAMVIAMAQAGADVAFTYRTSREVAQELASKVSQSCGVRCQGYQADVASAEQMETAVRQAICDVGPISVVVNNARANRDKTFLKLTRQMWDEVMSANLDGVFYTTQIVLRGMVASGWAHMINISSVVGQTGNFGQINYAAAKGAVIVVTESLGRELARKGISVNAVAPGDIETGVANAMPESAVEQVNDMTPAGGLGKPEEIAGAVVGLASSKSGFSTGQVRGI